MEDNYIAADKRSCGSDCEADIEMTIRQYNWGTKAIDVEMQSETLVRNNHTKEVNYTSSVSIKLSSDVDLSESKPTIAHPSQQ
ncbi:uncharacterized protein Bfra_010579 [Botrytis fragariae]|uniref:Uncharacterized protein n=1 Tax=Botrytis fragariae TaxID=1964551 RepID=A0A8H6AHV2_9HELO|nr:uncharacterized protein Bfra_010579 [Botrytis fragariae]KAF5867604.1 hypothetical protein Bfra_010579 [Botrytis fragariae]